MHGSDMVCGGLGRDRDRAGKWMADVRSMFGLVFPKVQFDSTRELLGLVVSVRILYFMNLVNS